MNTSTNNLNRSRITLRTCQWFFWLSFTLFLFSYAVLPIFDPDFWWHLRSGQAIFDNQGLLNHDPFTFSGTRIENFRETLILKSYWLWQLSAYGLYSLFGFKGISLLNLFVVMIMGITTAVQFQRRNINIILASLLITSGFYTIIATYQLERPQTVSFAFTTVLLFLFYRFEQTQRFNWHLPALMLVWANMHGGFIVGDILLGCFACGAIVQYRHQRRVLQRVFIWTTGAMLTSLLNPTGGLAFYSVATTYNSPLMTGVSEYQSTLAKFNAGDYYIAILWVLIALYYSGLLLTRRVYWPEFVVAIFLSWFAVMHMRNVGLFVPAMLPAIGRSWQEIGRRLPDISVSRWSKGPLVVLCGCFLLWGSYCSLQRRLTFGDVQQSYPEKAIQFLQTSSLQGRMFNDYEYGGYLLWKLAPRIRVFIDGRGIDAHVYEDYGSLKAASKRHVNGKNEYEYLLDKYQIDYVIQQVYRGDGSLQPLMVELLGKPDWLPIYQDNFVYIFSRLTPQNAEVISRYRIAKQEFKTRMQLLFGYLVQQYPAEVGFKIACAGMLTYMGMADLAREQILQIRATAPNDPSLPKLERDFNFLLGRLNRPMN